MKWILSENIEIPQDFLQAVQKQYHIRHGSKSKANFVAQILWQRGISCLLYTSPSPRDLSTSRMPSSA